jgi:hypothetical protein
MPRIPRPPEARRSERFMRIVANQPSKAFAHQFQSLTGIAAEIEWLSPLQSDEHAEYYDAAFLNRLGIGHLTSELSAFWPDSGPRWDGLARTAAGEVILVEAKAHLDEVITDCEAGASSTEKILAAFEHTKTRLGIPNSRRRVAWHSPYYQMCNRVAHLSFLHEHGVKAHLVFLCIADADDVPAPVSRDTWQVVLKHMRRSLSLDKHSLRSFDHDIILSPSDL